MLFMAPTAIRVIKKADYNGDYLKKWDTTSLDSFCLAGERCDPDTVLWSTKHMPSAYFNDTWW